jgi:hypothetical protein
MKARNKDDGTRRRLALGAGEGVRRLLDPSMRACSDKQVSERWVEVSEHLHDPPDRPSPPKPPTFVFSQA